MLVRIGLLYFVEELKLFISIVLVLNIFLKKLKNLSGIKTLEQTFFEYNQTIQCVDTSALDSLILCLQVKTLVDFTSLFFPYDFKKKMTV